MTGHDIQHPLEQLVRVSEVSTQISVQRKKRIHFVSDWWECLQQREVVALPAEACVCGGAVLSHKLLQNEVRGYIGSSLRHCRHRNLDPQLC